MLTIAIQSVRSITIRTDNDEVNYDLLAQSKLLRSLAAKVNVTEI